MSKNTIAIAMMVSGGVESPCRMLNGFLADKKFVNNTTQYAMSLFIPGLMCLLCGFLPGLSGN